MKRIGIGRLLLACIGFGLVACEQEYIPEDVFDKPDVVVEGYIQKSDSFVPTYVILTQSKPYLSTFSAEELNSLFVHGATVKVYSNGDSLQLTEICLNDLAAIDTNLRTTVLAGLGLPTASANLNVCIYADLNGFITGRSSIPIAEGRRYDLVIETSSKRLTATTTIPRYVPIDSIWAVRHPSYPANDSLFSVYGHFTDPAGEDNYYRIFTKRNQEQMFPASSLGTSGSVTDDKIFAGQGSSFAVLRGQPLTAEFDAITYGYFWRGDTVVVRGTTIDAEHYKYWKTMEQNISAQGPFGSYTRVKSNINGGLGIWGGVSFRDYRIILPR